MARKIAYIIGGMICIGFITYATIGVYLGLNVYKNDKKKADVIIVLGARSYKGQQYNPCLVARVKEGVTLLNNKYAGKIIFSGGTDREDGTNEAETMREIALEMKVPASAILLLVSLIGILSFGLLFYSFPFRPVSSGSANHAYGSCSAHCCSNNCSSSDHSYSST